MYVSPSAIYLELERMGFKVWYDNRADDLTKEGMRQVHVQKKGCCLKLHVSFTLP